MDEADAGCAVHIHARRHVLASVLLPVDGGVDDADANAAGATERDVDSDAIVGRAEDQVGEVRVVAWRRGIVVLAGIGDDKIHAGAGVKVVFE